jgi:Heat shock factor binding protein 1
MGHSILGRMDDMGTRMDELERSIAALLHQAGLDQNGFSDNTSFDTTTSFTSQTKTNTQRITPTTPHNSNSNKPNAQNKLHSPIGATASPTISIQPPISVVNDSGLISSLSHIVSPTQHDGSATPARTRVTIEI